MENRLLVCSETANVPILLGYVDYKRKIAGIGKTIFPSEMEKDMKEIMAFYKQMHPKYPENFSVDLNYSLIRKQNTCPKLGRCFVLYIFSFSS